VVGGKAQATGKTRKLFINSFERLVFKFKFMELFFVIEDVLVSNRRHKFRSYQFV